MAEIILNKGFKKIKYINVFCTFSEGRQDKFVVKTVCVSGCLKFYVTYTVHEKHEGKVLKVDNLSVVLEKELDMLEISWYMRSWEKTKDTQTVYHALAEYGQSVAVRDSIISMLQVNHSSYFWFRRCSNSGHYFIISLDFATGKELMQSEWAIKWDVQSHCMIDSFTFVFSNQDKWLYSNLHQYVEVLCAGKSFAADELKFYWHKLSDHLVSLVSQHENLNEEVF